MSTLPALPKVPQRTRYMWAQRDTRWDPYPQREPWELLRVEPDGLYFVKQFHEGGRFHGAKVCCGYAHVREAFACEIAPPS